MIARRGKKGRDIAERGRGRGGGEERERRERERHGGTKDDDGNFFLCSDTDTDTETISRCPFKDVFSASAQNPVLLTVHHADS